MRISEKMHEELNNQFMEEMKSMYLYLAMAAYFEDINYPGFAHWMRLQADEEFEHAMKFFDYINSRGGRVTLKTMPEPQQKWESILEAFKAAYEHEKYISDRINKLVELALEDKDYTTKDFLGWFLDEQVEEEQTVEQIVNDIEKIGESKEALFYLERELAQRQPGNENE